MHFRSPGPEQAQGWVKLRRCTSCTGTGARGGEGPSVLRPGGEAAGERGHKEDAGGTGGQVSNMQSRGSPFTSWVWTHLSPAGRLIVPILQTPIGTMS